MRHSITPVLLLAVPGVLVGTSLTALFTVYTFPYNWDWATALTFGAMMSATDPVAVVRSVASAPGALSLPLIVTLLLQVQVALLHELGAPKQLGVLIEGESLFNDGTGASVPLRYAARCIQHVLVRSICDLHGV